MSGLLQVGKWIAGAVLPGASKLLYNSSSYVVEATISGAATVGNAAVQGISNYSPTAGFYAGKAGAGIAFVAGTVNEYATKMITDNARLDSVRFSASEIIGPTVLITLCLLGSAELLKVAAKSGKMFMTGDRIETLEMKRLQSENIQLEDRRFIPHSGTNLLLRTVIYPALSAGTGYIANKTAQGLIDRLVAVDGNINTVIFTAAIVCMAVKGYSSVIQEDAAKAMEMPTVDSDVAKLEESDKPAEFSELLVER